MKSIPMRVVENNDIANKDAGSSLSRAAILFVDAILTWIGRRFGRDSCARYDRQAADEPTVLPEIRHLLGQRNIYSLARDCRFPGGTPGHPDKNHGDHECFHQRILAQRQMMSHAHRITAKLRA